MRATFDTNGDLLVRVEKDDEQYLRTATAFTLHLRNTGQIKVANLLEEKEQVVHGNKVPHPNFTGILVYSNGARHRYVNGVPVKMNPIEPTKTREPASAIPAKLNGQSVQVLSKDPKTGEVKIALADGTKTKVDKDSLQFGADEDEPKVAAYNFMSPSVKEQMQYEEAFKNLSSQEQKKFLKKSDDVLDQVGVKNHHGENAISDRADGAENSVVQTMEGEVDPAVARYSAALMGDMANQKSVLHFHAEPGGKDAAYEMQIQAPISDVRKVLDEKGIGFRTLVPTNNGCKVVLFDQNDKMLNKILTVGDHFDVSIQRTKGTGEYLGATDDKDPNAREIAHGEFGKLISHYEKDPNHRKYQPKDDHHHGGDSDQGGGKPNADMKGPITKEKVTAPPPTSEGEPLYEPNPNDEARVGIPKNSVPPPPAIGRLPRLTKNERLVEARFAKKYEANPEAMLEAYEDGRNTIVGYDDKGNPKYEIGDAPNIFATDDAKMLSDVYNPPKDSGVSKQDVMVMRARYNTVLHQTANAIAKKAFLAYLDKLKDGPADKKTVLVTAGGVACHGRDTPILMFDGSIKMVQDVADGDLLMGPDSQPRIVQKTHRGVGPLYRVIPIRGEPFVVNGDHILSLKAAVHDFPSGNLQTQRANWNQAGIDWVAQNRNKLWEPELARALCTRKSVRTIEQQQAVDAWNAANPKKPKKKRKLQLVNIMVRDILTGPKRFRKNSWLYRTGVEFAPSAVPLDPYYLGIWLGDGTNCQPSITSADEEVIEYLRRFVKTFPELSLKQYAKPNNKACVFQMTLLDEVPHPKKQFHLGGGRKNPITEALRQLNVWKNKHIPHCYLVNDRSVRLDLLAGLLDSDGYLGEAGGFDFITRFAVMADQIAFLVRSLGFGANVRKCWKANTTTGRGNTYYRLHIGGNNLEQIPTKVLRKQATARPLQRIDGMTSRNVLHTGYRIEPIGEGEFFGFTLDKDHLYLLGDFTVTHNSGKGHSLEHVESIHKIAQTAGAVFDAAGEQNSEENEWILDECKKRGIKATFLFVHSNPYEKWENPERGVIKRAGKIGRMVDARLFADSYTLGAKNFDKFHHGHKDDAQFIITDNTGKKPKVIPEIPRHALNLDADDLYAHCVSALQKAKGLDPAILRGGLNGMRIWPAGATAVQESRVADMEDGRTLLEDQGETPFTGTMYDQLGRLQTFVNGEHVKNFGDDGEAKKTAPIRYQGAKVQVLSHDSKTKRVKVKLASGEMLVARMQDLDFGPTAAKRSSKVAAYREGNDVVLDLPNGSRKTISLERFESSRGAIEQIYGPINIQDKAAPARPKPVEPPLPENPKPDTLRNIPLAHNQPKEDPFTLSPEQLRKEKEALNDNKIPVYVLHPDHQAELVELKDEAARHFLPIEDRARLVALEMARHLSPDSAQWVVKKAYAIEKAVQRGTASKKDQEELERIKKQIGTEFAAAYKALPMLPAIAAKVRAAGHPWPGTEKPSPHMERVKAALAAGKITGAEAIKHAAIERAMASAKSDKELLAERDKIIRNGGKSRISQKQANEMRRRIEEQARLTRDWRESLEALDLDGVDLMETSVGLDYTGDMKDSVGRVFHFVHGRRVKWNSGQPGVGKASHHAVQATYDGGPVRVIGHDPQNGLVGIERLDGTQLAVKVDELNLGDGKPAATDEKQPPHPRMTTQQKDEAAPKEYDTTGYSDSLLAVTAVANMPPPETLSEADAATWTRISAEMKAIIHATHRRHLAGDRYGRTPESQALSRDYIQLRDQRAALGQPGLHEPKQEEKEDEWDGEIDGSEVEVDDYTHVASWSSYFTNDDGDIEEQSHEVELAMGTFTPEGRDNPIDVFRWQSANPDAGDYDDSGEWTTDRDAAELDGRRFARSADQERPEPEEEESDFDAQALFDADGSLELEFEVRGETVEVTHRKIEDCTRHIYDDYIHNDIFKLHKQYEGDGFGARVFAAEVAGALKDGRFRYIDTTAARLDGTYNGYYTWLTLGYDAPLSELGGGERYQKIKKLLPHIQTLQDMMHAPKVDLNDEEIADIKKKLTDLSTYAARDKIRESILRRAAKTEFTGEDWWLAYGTSVNVEFDLSEGSRSRQILAEKMAKKKKLLEARESAEASRKDAEAHELLEAKNQQVENWEKEMSTKLTGLESALTKLAEAMTQQINRPQAPIQVTVQMPKSGPKRIERDENGNILRVVEDEPKPGKKKA